MALPFHDNTRDVRLRSGRVQRVCDGTYFVADSLSMVQVERSAGCLLQPEKGDLVLISENSMGGSHILTVLEREMAQPAMVSVDGDLLIKGQGDLSFKGEQSLNLLTPQIFLKARRGKMILNNFIFSGTLLTAYGRHLRSVCENVETKAVKMVERMNRLYRRVRDEDSRLGRMSCRVRGRFSIKTQDGSIDAEQHMRLSGDKIELG